ncbi:hypothetical protein [Ornithinibacillus xuwenensis]|uniref:Uncharacterized protein n=1 Tax=Ornithinibacillus xuwenensis TaxID=3144668 RepID=A0ABU9XEG5_9BACI
MKFLIELVYLGLNGNNYSLLIADSHYLGEQKEKTIRQLIFIEI